MVASLQAQIADLETLMAKLKENRAEEAILYIEAMRENQKVKLQSKSSRKTMTSSKRELKAKLERITSTN
jgi:hypothetical protein